MRTSDITTYVPGILTSITDRLPTTDFTAAIADLKAYGFLSVIFVPAVTLAAIPKGTV